VLRFPSTVEVRVLGTCSAARVGDGEIVRAR
jgi:hypothetical protein